MKLLLICNEEKIYDGEVSQVDVATENGKVTILPRHQPYMAKIYSKVVCTPLNNSVTSLDITEGFVYTNGEKCVIVVDKGVNQ